MVSVCCPQTEPEGGNIHTVTGELWQGGAQGVCVTAAGHAGG